MSKKILKLVYREVQHPREKLIEWEYQLHGGQVLHDSNNLPLKGVSSSYSWAMQDSQSTYIIDRIKPLLPNGYYLITEAIAMSAVGGQYWEVHGPPPPNLEEQEELKLLRKLKEILKKLV